MKKHQLYLTLILFFAAFTFLSCKDEPTIDTDDETEGDCITSILYNIRDGNTSNPNFKIGLSQNGEQTVLVEDENFDFWWPRLHPSNTFFICYKSPIGDNKPTNDYSRAELWRFDLDGSNGIKLIDLNKYGWQAQGTADWSPDGNYLIMHALDNDVQHLFRTDKDGNNLVQVSSGQGHKGDPSWSSDGTQIVYTGFPEDYDWSLPAQVIIDKLSGAPLEIHIADISEAGVMSNIQRITNDSIGDFDPYMSPDGRYIAWEALTGLVGTVEMYDKTTMQISTIVDDENAPCCPSWNQNSSEFLYHVFKPFVPFYIAKHSLESNEDSEILKESTKDYSNPQIVCWPQ